MFESRLLFRGPEEPPELRGAIVDRGALNVDARKKNGGFAVDIASNITKWDNRDFFKLKSGRNFVEERENGAEKLAKGEFIYRDVNLTFYKVVDGDTLSGILDKLSKYPEFSYLKNGNSLKNFNISPTRIKPGLWIPLPVSQTGEVLDDELFYGYCLGAILELKSNKIYGEYIDRLLKKIGGASGEGLKEMIRVMFAVAKVECGGKFLELGSTHRFEPAHNCFSYTMFHVLMKGPGLRARENLGMTEGQTLHPKNSAKLFLAFMIEKSGGDLEQFFPFDKNIENFSAFYNGKKYKETNPEYPSKLTRYYVEATKIFP